MKRKSTLAIIGFSVLFVLAAVFNLVGTRSAARPTPTLPKENGDARPMTVYAITNPNNVAITVSHVVTDAAGFYYTFSSNIPPSSTVEFHLRDIAAVPSPFDGSMTLSSDQPFTAAVTGFDYK
jgi:hypothetical protein